MTMYPYLNLLPIVALSFFIKSFVHLMCVVFMLRNFFSLILSYYSCKRFSRNTNISIIFAISYTLSNVTLYYAVNGMDMGISSSLLFMPLVLFGFYDLMYYQKWVEFSLGLTAIIFCHVMIAIIVLFMTLILIGCNFFQLLKQKFIPLLKALSVTILATAIFWIPFVVFHCSNKISAPESGSLQGIGFLTSVNNTFSNQLFPPCLSVIALIGFILILFIYKSLHKIYKQMFFLAIFFLIMNSNFFPWHLLEKTSLSALQFPYILDVVPQLILCYMFALSVIYLYRNNQYKNLIMPIIIFLLICIQFEGQQNQVDINLNSPKLNTFKVYENAQKNYRVQSQKNFKFMNNDRRIMDINDYWPRNTPSNVSYNVIHQVGIHGNKLLQMHESRNGKFEYNSRREIKSLKLPFIHYNGIAYDVTLDGRRILFHHDKHSLMVVNRLPKGHHLIQIQTSNNMYDYFGMVLSFLGVVCYIFELIKRRKKVHD